MGRAVAVGGDLWTVAAARKVQKGSEGTTEVAATAEQGAVTPVSHSDGRAAAETVVDGSENWQMGNAAAEKTAAAG